MKNLKDSNTLPMVFFGDFNEIVSISEKDGGAIRGERHMDAFKEAIDYCELRDLGFRGSIFTWKRGNSPSTVVRERLDRFMANDNWCELFSLWEVVHLPISRRSDHCPILLKTGENMVKRGGDSITKFEYLWLSKEECGQVVFSRWNDSIGQELPERICAVLDGLSSWASETFGDINKKNQRS